MTRLAVPPHASAAGAACVRRIGGVAEWAMRAGDTSPASAAGAAYARRIGSVAR